MSREPDRDSVLTLYRRGIELLEEADFEQATVPLEAAARRAPEKSSIREALGRAYFRLGRFAAAAVEFEAVVESPPGRRLRPLLPRPRRWRRPAQTDRARHHLALASNLRPERSDYRFYRDQLA